MFPDSVSANSSVELIRPSDVISYSEKDIISSSTSTSNLILFPNMARVLGGSGTIVRAKISTNQKANTAKYRLHLYRSIPVETSIDNTLFACLYSDASLHIGSIDFSSAFTEDATGSDCATTMRPSYDGFDSPPNIWYKCSDSDSKLYGILTTLSVFTPASAQKYYIQLSSILD